jgi:hypothetical protein
MGQEPIVCRYVYTEVEHRRAMRGFWFALKWPVLLLIIIVAGSMIGPAFLGSSNRTPPSPETQNAGWVPILNYAIPGIIIIGLMAYAVIRPGRVFRKSPFYEKEFDYSLEEDFIRVKNPLAKVELRWEAIMRAAENKDGFMLYLLNGRTFHWLPKAGFISPSEIGRARVIIRQQVKKARLFPD